MKWIMLLLFPLVGFGQLSVSNLAEYQLGNLPHTEPDNLSTLYDQFNLLYWQDELTVGLRLEHFQSTKIDRSYDVLSQRYIEWQSGAINVRLGNFYTTLGRGMVMRAFELPNVVFEQRELRRRYGYYRDIDGVLAQGTWKNFEFTALYGQPLDERVPPDGESDRHQGIVQGGQVRVRPTSWVNVGHAYLRANVPHAPLQQNEMNSLFIEFNASSVLRNAGLQRSTLKLYGEHARSNSQMRNFFSFSDDDPHATYLNLTFSVNKLGLSAEYKDYKQFENGINLPPIVYMEHSYYLLNRVTHEMLAENEQGYQFELTYRVNPSVYLLGNMSYARNEFFKSEYEFFDRMLEATVTVSDRLSGKGFVNVAKDELRGDLDRKTAGMNLDWQAWDRYALSFDVQHQWIDRGFESTITETFENSYAALTVSSSPVVSLSAVVERSTDSGETDDPTTPEIETDPQYWFNLSGSIQINFNHELVFFYGKRRGGLACTSGTCYEVLPFEGLELRWVAHF